MMTNKTADELRSLREQLETLSQQRDRLEADLQRLERDLAATPSDGVRRVLRWFDRESDELVGSAPLRGIGLPTLQQMFDVPSDNPMYDCFPVTPSQASQLQAYVDVPIELNRFDYFVEADATELPRTT